MLLLSVYFATQRKTVRIVCYNPILQKQMNRDAMKLIRQHRSIAIICASDLIVKGPNETVYLLDEADAILDDKLLHISESRTKAPCTFQCLEPLY
jgi:hypothetical protein